MNVLVGALVGLGLYLLLLQNALGHSAFELLFVVGSQSFVIHQLLLLLFVFLVLEGLRSIAAGWRMDAAAKHDRGVVEAARDTVQEREFSAKIKELAAAAKLNSELQLKLRAVEQELEQSRLVVKELGLEKERRSKLTNRDQEIDNELLNLLSLLQAKGRLIDFIMEDVTAYSDAQVGAVARIVHLGCASIIKDYFAPQPVTAQVEGSLCVLDSGYDPLSYRLIGQAADTPPYSGKILHRGWQATRVVVPRVAQLTQTALIIAPAEIDLSPHA